MRKCPVCQQNYADDSLNFCLNDGAALRTFNDPAPPTVFMNRAQTTNEFHPLDAHPPTPHSNLPRSPNQPYMTPAILTVQNQTLPTVSLVAGILSLVLGLCCFAGLPLGGAAVITGYLGLKNSHRDPLRCGGRGLAIGGMITGGIGFAISLLLLLFTLIKR